MFQCIDIVFSCVVVFPNFSAYSDPRRVNLSRRHAIIPFLLPFSVWYFVFIYVLLGARYHLCFFLSSTLYFLHSSTLSQVTFSVRNRSIR
jgi:hypothetical protein